MKISRLLSLLAIVAFAVSSARADYILTLLESGPNVVATGSGAFNFTGLVFLSGSVTGTGGILPSTSGVVTGSGNGQVWGQVGGLPGITGPSSFGSGGYTAASSFTGGLTAMIFNGGTAPSLVVPEGYMAGTMLSSGATWNNATFASLGATPGTYVWSWGAGGMNQTFTLQIGGATVPEAGSTIALLLLSAGALFGARRLCARPRLG